ncbi:5-(carboxyamino)imidazole ribonucleotide synthase [Lactobacillus sp. 23-2]|uniref:5-(carboxyamino)imidazole ribonucleotide synthase n=1 Tax=Lactobacillus sp. 23-2 TaxID=2981842 RepID=UPI003838C510
MSIKIKQGQTIGIIGGGQLGQMLTFDAKATGMKVIILDPTPDCPAAQAADDQIVAEYSDIDAIHELARRSDVLTYEFENVDLKALESVKDQVYIPQGTNLLYVTKHRIREKTFIQSAGCRVTDFLPVKNREELTAAVEQLGLPAVLKTCEGGYDGKGQVFLRKEADLDQTAGVLSTGDCILEKLVDFKTEASVMVGRNSDGEVTVFPVSENINQGDILHESIVPARLPEAVQEQAQKDAVKIAKAIKLVGILGVEMFITKDDQVLINELAPRPHNSGHYSIEACNFSQFAVHNRAICNWPLPKIKLLSPVVMVNVLGQHVDGVHKLIPEKPQWSFHDYGKAEVRYGRKMGHITILTDDIDQTLREIKDTKVWDA